MRKIKQWTALLLTLVMLLCGATAQAEASDEILSTARTMAEEALDTMKQGAAGWVAKMLAGASITDVAYASKSVNVSVAVPTLASGVKSTAEAGDDLAGYLAEAFDPYLTGSVTTTLTLNLQYTEKDGTITYKWSGGSNPRNFLSKLKSLAGKAKKTFTYKQIKAALGDYLLPKAAAMPKKQPEAAPEFAALTDYTSRVADTLSLTAEQAEMRLPSLMLLMELYKIDTTEPLDSTVLTLKVKNWQTMLDEAEASAKLALTTMMGVPDMTRLEIERVFCAQLPTACLIAYYAKKSTTETEVTVALDAAVREGPQMAEGIMDVFRTYDAAVESKLDSLMTYGAGLAYYPRVALIDSGVLTGADVADGRRVTFDLGSDETNHGYVRVEQDGAKVFTGFIRQHVRLAVRLNPGTYTVYYGIGPEWYGEAYIFGKEATYGSFALTVGEAERTIVHMAAGSGDLSLTPLTWEEFPKGE